MTRALLLLALTVGPIISAPRAVAEPLPPQDRLAQPRTVISASRRFIVTGLPAARATELARWAEEVADRIQRQTGPLPFERAQFITIEADAQEGLPEVESKQTCVNGEIVQTLALRGLDQLDMEQAEEVLGGLLISRFIHTAQRPAARCPEPARASDWLVVALVHAGNPDLRRRNLDHALARRRAGEITPFAALVDQHVMPAGRWPQKADAMALWLWLSESPRAGAMLAEAFRLQAEGRRPDAGWWAEQRLGERNSEAAARAWEQWLDARQGRTRLSGSGESESILNVRVIPAQELEAAGGPRTLADQPLDALIPLRKEPWCRPFAIRHALRIRLEAIGHEEEAQQVAEAYAVFLDRLAKGEAARRLASLWKDAERRRERYAALLDARRRFLDAVEEQYGAPRPPADPVTRYLDEVEARMEAKE